MDVLWGHVDRMVSSSFLLRIIHQFLSNQPFPWVASRREEDRGLGFRAKVGEDPLYLELLSSMPLLWQNRRWMMLHAFWNGMRLPGHMRHFYKSGSGGIGGIH